MLAADGIHNNKRRVFIVVSPTNVVRMMEGDPITIEQFPMLELVLAYDENADTLAARFATSEQLVAHLFRGYKFDPKTDGQTNALAVRLGQEQFSVRMNDMVASMTRAWTDFELTEVTIKGENIGDNEAKFEAVLTAKRRGSVQPVSQPGAGGEKGGSESSEPVGAGGGQ